MPKAKTDLVHPQEILNASRNQAMHGGCHETYLPDILFRFASNTRGVVKELPRLFPSQAANCRCRHKVTVCHCANEQILSKIVQELRNIPPVAVIETFKNVFHAKYATGVDGVEIFLPQAEAKYAVLKSKEAVVLLTGARIEKPQQFIKHIYRELLLRFYEDDGAALFHSAMVSFSDSGVMIMGPSHSGKTTFMLSLIELLGALYISNDRTMLSMKDMTGIGFPLPIRVGFGTIFSSAGLSKYLKQNFDKLIRPQILTAKEFSAIKNMPAEWDVEQKLEIETEELRDMLGTSVKLSATVRLIIVPQISNQSVIPAVIKLSPEELEMNLLRECLTPSDPLWLNPWLHVPAKSKEELLADARKQIKALSKKIPGLRVCFGHDFHKILNYAGNDFKQTLNGYLHGSIR